MLRFGHSHLLRNLHSEGQSVKAIVAVGSNVGNRANTIHAALNKLRQIGQIGQTSFLYESKPMYLTDQPLFLNAALQLSTKLSPAALLQALKQIERELGRDKNGVRHGPRPIDLDIITYGPSSIDTPDLQIPHPRLAERQFVLQPLYDISPTLQIPLQSGITTPQRLLSALQYQDPSQPLTQVTPTARGDLLKWGDKTLIMGVINATPDSFSDGGKHNTVESALQQAEQFSKFNFDVIDIGGQSTRPGATPISAEEEMERVLPITQAIRQSFPHMLISADTFYSTVAHAMIQAGAHIINEVTAGSHDADMYKVIRENNCAAILMHMRGTPATMQTLTEYNSDIATHVGTELNEKLQSAQRHGIPRWSLMADPGIGFAKKASQSKQLLRTCSRFKMAAGGFPVVLGASRKSWLKSIEVVDRDWATAGATGVAIARGGVDMVRVHHPQVADAVRTADALR